MKMKEIFQDFQTKMTPWVRDMKNCFLPDENKSVFSHLQTVYLKNEINNIPLTVKYALLLQDIGKPFCRKENEQTLKVSFVGHEGLSALMAREYLDQTSLSIGEKIQIIKLISLQSVLVNNMSQEDWEFILASKFKNQSNLLKDLIILYYLNSLENVIEKEKELSLQKFQSKFDLVFEAIKELEEQKQELKPKEIVLLVGCPNSGKSTYLKSKKDGVILSRDEVITSLFPKLSYNDAYHKADSKEVDSLFSKKIQEQVNLKPDRIYFDLTNMSHKARRRNWGAFSQKEYKIKTVVFLTPLKEIFKRNQKRKNEGKFIPEDVIYDMAKKFTFPLSDETEGVEIIY